MTHCIIIKMTKFYNYIHKVKVHCIQIYLTNLLVHNYNRPMPKQGTRELTGKTEVNKGCGALCVSHAQALLVFSPVMSS